MVRFALYSVALAISALPGLAQLLGGTYLIQDFQGALLTMPNNPGEPCYVGSKTISPSKTWIVERTSEGTYTFTNQKTGTMAGYNAGAERTDFIKNSGAVTTFTLMPALPVARRQIPLTYYILGPQDGVEKLGVISKKQDVTDTIPNVQLEELDTPPEAEAKWIFKQVQE